MELSGVGRGPVPGAGMLGREAFAGGARYCLVLSHVWEGPELEATAGPVC